MKDDTLETDDEIKDMKRRFKFLIDHAYTQHGDDGVNYWVLEIFPVGKFETFEESLDAEILKENQS